MQRMPSSLSNAVFFIAFLIYATIRGIFERRTARNVVRVNRRDAREIALMTGLGTGTVLLPLIYLGTPWLAFADYQPPTLAPWCGVVSITAALWLFWRSHADLGENWSMTLQLREGHQLIRHGVYRRVRHPMYAAIWLFSLSQGLLLHNWLAGWAAFALFAIVYLVRLPSEESMMRESFGEDYVAYMRDTGRIFPRVRSRG